jgi:hypothetical protein
MELLFGILGMALLGAMAVGGGADSRDGEDWHHHRAL